MSVSASSLRDWLWFVVWLLVGSGFTLGVLTPLTIGVFVIPAAVIAAIALARIQGRRGELLGLLSGLGVPLLYVGYLNRGGPGDVCTTARDGGHSCTEEWSPWPWVALGTTLVLAGVLLFARHRIFARHGATSPRA